MRIGSNMGPMAITSAIYRKYTKPTTKLPDYVKNCAVDVSISAQAKELAKAALSNGDALKFKLPNVGEE